MPHRLISYSIDVLLLNSYFLCQQKLSDREIAFTELEYEKTILSEESRRLKEEIGELRSRVRNDFHLSVI